MNYRRLKYILVIFFGLMFLTSQAQRLKDTVMTIPFLKTSIGFHLPGGDLADRFGFNASMELGFTMKLSSQWILSASGSYIFGNQIKEDGILDSLMTSGGFIINQNGNPAEVRLYERGFNASLMFGRLFPIRRLNKNSGLVFMAGPQFLMHKIKIDDVGKQTAQLVDPYPKGYDRLTAGIGAQEFIGFMFFSKRKTVNFYGGFEFIQASTKSQRSFDYDLMKPDTRQRMDLLFGFRMGWIIPFYKRNKPDFYYY